MTASEIALSTGLPAVSESDPQRLRVAMILYRDDLNVGGSLRVAETMANALDPTRVEVHLIFAYGEPGPVAARAKVACHFLRSKGPLDALGWIRARSLFRRIDPHILHFHNPAYWLHGASAGRHYRKVIHIHGPFFRMGPSERFLMAQTKRLADAAVCITRGTRQITLDCGWGSPERTWTVYNAIDCDSFTRGVSRNQARAQFELPKDALVAGVVCRLAWYKGCRDAIGILRRLNPRWHVMFCGSGPMQDYLVRAARLEGLEDRTHFTGMLDDIRPAYAAMDAFLFLSRLEPFGLVTAEAMASRVPVFGLAGDGDYREPGYPLITPDNSIFVERCHRGDYCSPEPAPVLDQLARQMDDFGWNKAAYQPMIDRAEQWVRERFDARVQADSMFEVYERVAGRPTDAPK